jgi:hypothetical protein
MSDSKAGDRAPRWLVTVGSIAALLASLATIVGVLLATGIISNPFGAHTATAKGFVGAWESTDRNGSHQTLTITADSQVTYNEDRATTCGGRPFYASGAGTTQGTQLTVVLSAFCLQPRESHGTATITFTYNPSRDTLADSFGILWSRQG